jgi:hypothetical protein
MGTPVKRFTDTGKWNDPWFRALTPTAKLLWSWLLDNCDNAGVIDPDIMLAAFQIGERVEEKHIAELGNRLQRLPSGKLWIPKFIKFQFGALSEESRVHSSVVKLLENHRLLIEYRNRIDTVAATPKDIDKDKEKNKDKRKATLEEVKLCCVKAGLPESDAVWFWNKCEGNGWTNGGKPILSWPHTIASWKAGGYMPSQKNGQHPKFRKPGGNF